MNDVWYFKGLRFECKKCGNCCGGAPGFTFVSQSEIALLARSFEMTPQEFQAAFAELASPGDPQLSLREKPNYDCIFYDIERGCGIYLLRPRQCRTWPFWARMLSSLEAWEKEARHCPGMNSGRLYTPEEIQQISGL